MTEYEVVESVVNGLDQEYRVYSAEEVQLQEETAEVVVEDEVGRAVMIIIDSNFNIILKYGEPHYKTIK